MILKANSFSSARSWSWSWSRSKSWPWSDYWSDYWSGTVYRSKSWNKNI